MPLYPPITARQELDALLNAAIEIALKMIGKHGNHIPFAIVVRMNGERLDIAVDNSEVHDGAILEKSLLNELRAMVSKNEVRSIAFARNIEYQSAIDHSHVDAIEVDLDHLDDRAVTCMLPYKMSDDMQPVPGEFFAIEPREHFFSPATKGG